MRRPTIGDIARRAGVSKGAVSYALNGRPGVSDATRRRIIEIAAEIGWQPSSAARALSDGRADVLGLVVDRPARTLGLEPFFMQLISGIEGALASRSIGLLLQMTEDQNTEIEFYRRWWAQRRVDGVILVDLRLDDPRVRVLEELRMPAVVIGGPEGVGGLPAVWSDDGEAIRSVLEYLAALGHRSIARVAGVRALLHTELRTRAMDEIAAELGVETITVYTDYSGEEGASATRSLLARRPRPTAIVYDNDVMAVAGAAVAQEMGVPVPGGLSIVAWDDSPLCRLVHPRMSAVSRDIAGYGAHAAECLLDVIAGREITAFQDATPKFVPRGSTAPPS
ncbi:LacI family DNA-binding transcriptional regulator [Thermopolyspora sp. NPDC052614]|uniref:LacI family DNA-binding transcriptional regulator n=1 Tax=Thermopolyspora sp. NPDC052614 TaxID=3155682 RepID=UPI003437BBAE